MDPAVLSGLCEVRAASPLLLAVPFRPRVTASSILGRAQATAPVYDLDCFPQCCCGPARLLWRPQQQPGTNRSLWVWAHPGTASTLIPALAGASDAVSCAARPPTVAALWRKGHRLTVRSLPPCRRLRPATSLARLQLRGPTALACLRRVLAEAVRSGQAAGGAWDALAPIHSAHLLLDGLALPLAVMDPRPAAVRARKALAARAEQRAADTHARHYYAPQSAGAPAPAPAQAAADTLEAAGAAHLAALGDWEHGYDAHAAADGALLGEEDEAALSAADAGGAPSLLRALAAMGAGATPDARAASGAAHDAHAAALDRVRGLADRAAATASSAAEAAAAEDGRCLRRQHDEVRRQEAITRLQAGDATMASHAIVGERAGEGHATAAAAATSAAGTAPGRERSARRGPRQPSAASTQAHALLDALRAPEWDGSSPGPRAGLLLASGSHPLWDASTRAAARDCLPNETALHRVRSLQLAYSAEPGEGERRARESGASQRFAEATARKEKAKAAARVEQARAAAATAAPPPDALLEAEREDWSAVAQCAPLTVVARSLPSAGCRPAGTGVDIVLPAGWVRALWTPLVAAGAAAAGVEDVAALAAEVGCPSFPADWPDTATHATASHAAAVHSVSKLLRTPSKRRAPHWALRAHAPCSPAWHTLFPGAPASEEGKGAPAETTPQGVGAELAGGGEQEQEQGGSDGGEEGGVDEAGAGDQADGEEGVPAVPGPPLPPGWDQRASQVPSWLFDPDAEAAFDELVVIRGVRAAQQLLGPVVAPEGTPAPRRDPRWQADAEEDAPAGAGLSRGLLVDPAVPAYLRSGQVPASMAALAFPALVAVRIVMMGRGRPEPLAYVALPEGDDVAQWVAHGARWCGWEEPVAKGPRKRGRGASSASATRGRNQATSSAVHGFPSQVRRWASTAADAHPSVH